MSAPERPADAPTLEQQLASLRLAAVAQHYQPYADTAAQEGWSYPD